MAKALNSFALLVSIITAVVVTACSDTRSTRTEKTDGIEWDVTVNRTVKFNDSLTGINTDVKYSVADTARINQKLRGIKPENLTLDWTIPDADGSIWLVAYESTPILSEKVSVTEANVIPSYGGNVLMAFKFTDAKKWETVTKEYIGKIWLYFVNSRLMNAPQVMMEIASGNCSVSIPAEMIHDYFPDIDLDYLKQE